MTSYTARFGWMLVFALLCPFLAQAGPGDSFSKDKGQKANTQITKGKRPASASDAHLSTSPPARHLTAQSDCDLYITIDIGNCVAGSSTVPVDVTVDNPDGHADIVEIFHDGVQYPWSPLEIDDDEPVIFTGWFTPGTTHTIYANSTEEPNCDVTITFYVPPCTCSINATATVSGPCDPNTQTVPVTLVVTANSPPGSGFDVTLDGSLYPGSPFTYAGSSSTTVVIQVPGTGSSHPIVVADEQNAGCNDQLSITTPLCQPPQCALGVTAVVSGPCDGNLQVPVTVTVTESNGGTGFNLLLDGSLYPGSPFNYSAGSSTTVTINVNGTGTNHTILIRDAQNNSCQATVSLTTPLCQPPQCSLAVAAIVSGPCNSNLQVPVTLTVTESNGGTGFNLLLDGTLYAGSPFNYSAGSSTTVTINVNGTGTNHTILVRDAQNNACQATMSLTTPLCQPPQCSLAVSATVSGGCNANLQVPVSVVVTESNGGSGFNLFLDGALLPGSPFTYSAGSSTTTNILVNGNGASHTIQVADAQSPACQATTSVSTPLCTPASCSLTLTAAVNGPCDTITQRVPVLLNVTSSNSGAAGFYLFLDGVIVPGGPRPYGSGGTTTLTLAVPGTASLHTIQVQDALNPTCSASASVTTPQCGTGACAIAVNAALAGVCNGNNQIPIAVTVTAANAGASFNLLMDGNPVTGSPFAFTGGSATTTVILLVSANGVAHGFVAESTSGTECSATTTLTTPQCSSLDCRVGIAATITGGCTGNLQVPVSVTITSSNTGSTFNLLLDGQILPGGPFTYDADGQTTVNLNLPANGVPHPLRVQDVQSPACYATTILTLPLCPASGCSTTISATVSGGCNAAQNVPVAVTVSTSGGSGSFQLYLDGALVPGSPFQHSGASSTTVTIQMSGDGDTHTLRAQDSQNPACSGLFQLSVPDCSPAPCALAVTAAVTGACNASQQVPVTVMVTSSNSGMGFNLFLDGTLVSDSPFTYSTSGSNTSVTINVPGNGAAHLLQVVDSQSPGCSATTTVLTPNCVTPTCSLAISAAVAGPCNAGQQVPVSLSITNFNSSAGFNLFLDGALVSGSPFTYSAGSSTSLSINVPGNGAAHLIQIFDSQNQNCSANTTVLTPDCTPPSCALEVTAAVVGTCNAAQQVPVSVTVTESNGGTAFNLFLDGTLVSGSPFTYSISGSNTSVTINVPGNGAAHLMQVSDSQSANCSANTTLVMPNCVPGACSINVTAAVAGGCNANQQVPVSVVVTESNGGTAFNLFLDGALVTGSPFTYSTAGSNTTIAINVPGDGAAHVVQVIDNQNQNCLANTTVLAPDCTPTPCALGVVAAVSGPCNSNQQVPVTLTITESNGGSGFNVFLDGVWFGGSSFTYGAGSSTSVTITAPGDGAVHLVQIVDSQHPDCSATTTLLTPECVAPTCSFNLTAAVAGPCNANQQVPVSVTVMASNAGSTFNLFLDGALAPGSPFPYAGGSSTTVTLLVPGNGATHTLSGQDATTPTCTDATSVTTPLCGGGATCALTLAVNVGACNGNGQAPVTVTVNAVNPESTGFNLYIDGTLQAGSPFPYAASSTTILVAGNGVMHNVLVSDAGNANCAAAQTVSLPDCNLPCQILDVTVGGNGPRTHVVAIEDYWFTPPTLTVLPGDTVRFVWVSPIPHSTTSDAVSGPDHWDSGVIGQGSVYDVVIHTPGNHPYYCSNHGGPNGIGMTGVIVALAPCDGLLANIPVQFTAQHGGANGFNIFVDGAPLAGNPQPYQNPNGLNDLLLPVPGTGGLHTVTIQDALTSFCAYSVTFTAPICSGGGCHLQALAIQTAPCDANQQVGYALTVTPTQAGMHGFNVMLDGALLPGSPFAYANGGSPTTINLTVNGDGMNHALTVTDVDSLGCFENLLIQAPLCSSGPCVITGLTYEVNAPALHVVTVGDNFFSPELLNVETGDTVRFIWSGMHPHTVTSDNLTGDDVFNSGLHTTGYVFDVVLQTPGAHPYYCIPHGSPGGIGMAGLLTAYDACENDSLPVTFHFESANGSAQGFMVMLDGMMMPGIGLQPYAASGTNTLTVEAPADGLPHEFMLMDAEAAGCVAIVNVDVPDCGDPCLAFNPRFEIRVNTFDLSVLFTTSGAASGTTYTWNFGDGQTGQGSTATHQFSEGSSYQICLYAESANGCRDTLCETLDMSDPCIFLQSDFTYMVDENDVLTLHFQDGTSAFPNQWLWGFGDGQTSTAQNPSHTYAAPGAYNVCLIAADEGSCTTAPHCQVVFVNTVGTHHLHEMPLVLYPNPLGETPGQVTLEGLQSEDFGQELAVRLVNIQGQLVGQLTTVGAEKTLIQIEAPLAAGMYWIEVQGAERGYRGKLVVVK